MKQKKTVRRKDTKERPNVLKWEKMFSQSLMVEVFGVGTVEIDVRGLADDERSILEVYVYPLGGEGVKPLSNMRTLMPVPEEHTERMH